MNQSAGHTESTHKRQKSILRISFLMLCVSLFSAGTSVWAQSQKPKTAQPPPLTFDTPFWEVLKDPEDLLSVMLQIPEPYTPPMLDALQAALPNFPNISPAPGLVPASSDSPMAALILYRYNRPAGYAFYSRGLTLGSTLSATIFAMNQDTAMLPEILRLIPTDTDDSKFIDALGEWHSPAVADALWSVFQQNPDDFMFAPALAEQDMHQATPLIRSIYFSSSPKQIQKIYAAAALVSLEGKKAPQILTFLLKNIDPVTAVGPAPDSDDPDLRYDAIQMVTYLRLMEATPALKARIRVYLEKKPVDKSDTTMDSINDTDLAVLSARALARLQDSSSNVLISELLLKLKKNDEDSKRLLSAARAALDLGVPQAVIRQAIGADQLTRELQVRKMNLKRVPTDEFGN